MKLTLKRLEEDITKLRKEFIYLKELIEDVILSAEETKFVDEVLEKIENNDLEDFEDFE